MIDFSLHTNDLTSLAISVLCGGLIGLEREYKNKTAGFRTIILICFGSTIFTIISQRTGDDRIASTVVTGIGFIGAGVIFKDDYWVKGLTTSAVIWVSAAIGMFIGIGDYTLSFVSTLIVLLVLSLLHYIEKLVDSIHHSKQYAISFKDIDLQHLHQLEALIKERGLTSKRIRVSKHDACTLAILFISGKKEKVKSLNEFMISLPEIKSFHIS